jgi:hypothetical protein
MQCNSLRPREQEMNHPGRLERLLFPAVVPFGVGCSAHPKSLLVSSCFCSLSYCQNNEIQLPETKRAENESFFIPGSLERLMFPLFRGPSFGRLSLSPQNLDFCVLLFTHTLYILLSTG